MEVGAPLLLLKLENKGVHILSAERRAADPAELHNLGQEITVYDANAAAPTRVPGEVVWVADDDGSPAFTTTEMIMVLPTEPPASSEVTPGGGGQQPQQLDHDTDSDSHGTGDAANLFGISYAPYRANHDCKSAEDIMDDFQRFKGDYSLVRIYGTDCNQVPNVYPAAKDAGVKIMLGIWDIHSVQNEASKIVDGLHGDWDIVHSVSVGNELVNNGDATPQQVTDAVAQARQILRQAGYTGPVVTVDTFIAVESHPELCEKSDYCAINAHPFFDSTMAAGDAGKWLQNTVQKVKSALSKPMEVVVTETGWPTDGDANGLAVPGLANQKAAIKSIKNTFSHNPSDVVLFSAFDDLWKEKTMTTFNADQHWGIGGAIAKSDVALV